MACGIFSLRCSMWDLVPRPGTEPRPLALGAWSLSHWTTWKALSCLREFSKLSDHELSLMQSPSAIASTLRRQFLDGGKGDQW